MCLLCCQGWCTIGTVSNFGTNWSLNQVNTSVNTIVLYVTKPYLSLWNVCFLPSSLVYTPKSDTYFHPLAEGHVNRKAVQLCLWFWSGKYMARGPGSSVGIVTDYGLDGPGSSPGGDEIFPPVQTDPGAHPASCTMGTGSFLGVKCGRGVLLTTHPLLVPRSWKSRAIPLPTLWATLGL